MTEPVVSWKSVSTITTYSILHTDCSWVHAPCFSCHAPRSLFHSFWFVLFALYFWVKTSCRSFDSPHSLLPRPLSLLPALESILITTASTLRDLQSCLHADCCFLPATRPFLPATRPFFLDPCFLFFTLYFVVLAAASITFVPYSLSPWLLLPPSCVIVCFHLFSATNGCLNVFDVHVKAWVSIITEYMKYYASCYCHEDSAAASEVSSGSYVELLAVKKLIFKPWTQMYLWAVSLGQHSSFYLTCPQTVKVNAGISTSTNLVYNTMRIILDSLISWITHRLAAYSLVPAMLKPSNASRDLKE